MTILSVIQSAATVIGMDVPSVVAASTNREHVEMVALANEMAGRIATAYDWQELSRVHTISGDGASEAFSLPSDYGHMTEGAQVWSSTLITPFSRISDVNEWLGLEVQAFDFVINAWIIFGNEIHIKPAIPTGETAKFFYQSTLCVAPATGDNKTSFTADTDTFRLDETLLKLGIIWQWKANKGQQYAEDMANFEERKAKLIGRDKGSKMLTVGRRKTPSNVTTAYPMAIIP